MSLNPNDKVLGKKNRIYKVCACQPCKIYQTKTHKLTHRKEKHREGETHVKRPKSNRIKPTTTTATATPKKNRQQFFPYWGHTAKKYGNSKTKKTSQFMHIK